MQKIPLALAEADMVLARDVFREDNAGGPPICGKGLTLTESLIERLKSMGVQTIVVEGHPVLMSGDKSPEELLEALDYRFRKAANDPLTGKLKSIYRQYLVRTLGIEE
ncbi:MAG TPA: hypothetical protein VMJ66_01135 [Geobacteraceae bacterium]|nr:hypothetical protein [Geobacteraceae bacterium]